MKEQWATACAITQLGAPPLAADTGGRTARSQLVCQCAGSAFRLVLGEMYGKKPVHYGKIVIQARGELFCLTFGGSPQVTVEPGAALYSDPVACPLAQDETLTVWLYNSGKKSPVSLCLLHQEHSAPGDFCGQAFEREPFVNRMAARMGMDEVLGGVLGLEVLAERADGIAAFGDSITALDIWVSPLRAQLRSGGVARPVFNLGVGGNRLLRNTNLPAFPGVQVFGRAGLARMQWDVLERPGLQTVILALGINDISQPGGAFGMSPPAREVCTLEQLLAGYQTFISAAHKAGLQAAGATITPFGGYRTYSGEKETLRRAANDWILQPGNFDAALDFAAAVCSKEAPQQLAAEYDSGDHLHPNAAGGLVMAEQAVACPLLN